MTAFTDPKVCAAPVGPLGCGRVVGKLKSQQKSHLCEEHWTNGWPGCGWRRVFVESAFDTGEMISYIEPDAPCIPFLIDPSKITGVGERHEPSHGPCPCCHDRYVTETSIWITHTTWGFEAETSVCWECATNCPTNPKYHQERVKRQQEERKRGVIVDAKADFEDAAEMKLEEKGEMR